MPRSTVTRSPVTRSPVTRTAKTHNRILTAAQLATLQTLKPISYYSLTHPNDMLWTDLATGAMSIGTVQADFALIAGLGANAVRVRGHCKAGALQLGGGLQPTAAQLAALTAVLAAARDAGLLVYLCLFDSYNAFQAAETQTYLASLGAALPANHTVVALELKNEVSSSMTAASTFASWLPQIIPAARTAFPGAAVTVSVFGQPDGSSNDGAAALRWLTKTALGGQIGLLDFYSVHNYQHGTLERQSCFYAQCAALLGGVPLNNGESGFATSFSDVATTASTMPNNLAHREAIQEYNLRQMLYVARALQTKGSAFGDPCIWQLYDYPGYPDYQPSTQPTVTAASGGILTASATHHYAVVWSNSQGETCPFAYAGNWSAGDGSTAGVKTGQGFGATSLSRQQVFPTVPAGTAVVFDGGANQETVTISSATTDGSGNTTYGFTTTKTHTLPCPVRVMPGVALGAGQGSFVVPALQVPYGMTGCKVYVEDADNSLNLLLFTGAGGTQGPFSADGSQMTAPVTVSGYGAGAACSQANTTSTGTYINSTGLDGYAYGLYRNPDASGGFALKLAGVTLQNIWKNSAAISTYWNQDFEMAAVPDFAGVTQYPPLWRGQGAGATSGFAAIIAGSGVQHGGAHCLKISGAYNTTGGTKFPSLTNVPFFGLLDPTKIYTATAWINVAGLLVAASVRLNIGWVNVNGVSLPNTTTTVSAANGGYTQYTASAKPPTGAAGLTVFLSLSIPANTAVGADTTTLIYVDDLTFSWA